MNLDDESLLSAYLDDELDPADRLPLEWSVESSPPLADQLRALALARDAVAGLDRPSPPRDLAFVVVAGLVAAQRPTRLQTWKRSGQLTALAAGLAAMAACLLLAVVLLHRSTHDDAHPSLFKFLDRPAPTGRPHTVSSQADSNRPSQIPEKKNSPALHSGKSSGEVGRQMVPGRADLLAEGQDAARRRRVGGMMDQRRVLRAVIVTDIIDDASDRVRSLILADARKDPDFGRIRIGQGIVVDEDYPEQADVYPVVLDEPGSRQFLARLEKEFPDLVIEPEVSAELLTQLPEVGQVALFRGTGAGRLVDPPGELRPYIAQRNESDRPGLHRVDDDPEPLRPGDRSGGLVLPTTEDLLLDRRIPRRAAAESVAIMVWITRPTRR